jgi:hypothetical protein
MELNDAERYAAAALFTLALHSTQVRVLPPLPTSGAKCFWLRMSSGCDTSGWSD